MAALGLIHRTVLDLSPPHFKKWFSLNTSTAVYNTRHQEKKHNKQLLDYVSGEHTELLRRSLLGQTRVYNCLPQAVVNATTVKGYQKKLQDNLKDEARRGCDNWQTLLAARSR